MTMILDGREHVWKNEWSFGCLDIIERLITQVLLLFTALFSLSCKRQQRDQLGFKGTLKQEWMNGIGQFIFSCRQVKLPRCKERRNNGKGLVFMRG